MTKERLEWNQPPVLKSSLMRSVTATSCSRRLVAMTRRRRRIVSDMTEPAFLLDTGGRQDSTGRPPPLLRVPAFGQPPAVFLQRVSAVGRDSRPGPRRLADEHLLDFDESAFFELPEVQRQV